MLSAERATFLKEFCPALCADYTQAPKRLAIAGVPMFHRLHDAANVGVSSGRVIPLKTGLAFIDGKVGAQHGIGRKVEDCSHEVTMSVPASSSNAPASVRAPCPRCFAIAHGEREVNAPIVLRHKGFES